MGGQFLNIAPLEPRAIISVFHFAHQVFSFLAIISVFFARYDCGSRAIMAFLSSSRAIGGSRL